MPDKGTKRIDPGGRREASSAARETRTFVASDESRAKARKFRIFALLSWVVAIGLEVGAILLLQKPPVTMWLLIVLIVADLVFAVVGSLLWKKANRFDPASEKEKFKFFVQNQLGAIIAVIAFLPLVILIFTNKDLKGKQKGLVGAVAVVAMLIAGFVGVDFNPPSQEQYAQQIEQVKSLGAEHIYWTKSGTRFHLYQDCQHINTRKTDEIFQGTVPQARELKNITELCKTCEGRWKKEHVAVESPVPEIQIPETELPAGDAVPVPVN